MSIWGGCCLHAQRAAAVSDAHQLPAGFEEAVADAVEQLAGTMHLLRAAAHAQAGDRTMAVASARTFLCCYAHRARTEDCCLAYAQLAMNVSETEGYDAAERVSSPEHSRMVIVDFGSCSLPPPLPISGGTYLSKGTLTSK